MKRFKVLTAALCAVVLLCGFSVPAYARGGEDFADGTGGVEQQWEGLDSAEALPVEIPEPEVKPFRPSGTGTVVDNATDEDGKEFFTITTPAENVFYLIIDRQRGTENVYCLNAVTEADLLALAELPDEIVTPAPTPAPDPEPTPEPTAPPESEAKGGAGSLLLVLAMALIGGGAAFYFKVYRPKQQKAAESDDDMEYGDFDGSEDYDEEDSENGGPPWDEDDDAGEEDK